MSLVLLIWSCLLPVAVGTTWNLTACSSLAGIPLLDGAGRVVTATPFLVGSNFSGNTAETGYNAIQTNLPNLCRVTYHVKTTFNNSAVGEVWLPPPSEWNKRLLTVGNGGFAGGVNYPDIVWGIRKGFATMSTDTGHNSSSSDGSWLGNPEQLIDWGHRALHLTTVAAKEVIRAYYASPPGYSYYAGCSTGGRQGLNAAQRYPTDFNGVLVGSSIPWQTHTSGWQTYVALLQFPNNRTTYIPATMWSTIHAEVLEQCDDIDGLNDGIIMDPSKCSFHPDILLCTRKHANSSACLSSDQLMNLKRMYLPWLDSKSNLINPGISPGGEGSFSILMNGNQPTFGPTFYSNAIYNNTNWDWSTMSVDDINFADQVNPGGSNAYNPDMRPFQDAGGKLIHYHGYADPLIPSLNAAAWYDRINSFYASVGEAGSVEDFYRLFMVPGMGHCSGGVGAWVLDGASQGGVVPKAPEHEYSMLWSLVDWVESSGSSGPEKVIGTHYVDNNISSGVDFTRPICRWPTVAQYIGGKTANASSWICPPRGAY